MSGELIGAAALTSRYVVAFVFATAAIPKLVDRAEFERAVANYSLLPAPLVPVVAAWLPRLELVCAFALLFGVAVTPVAGIAGALLVAFAVVVAVNLVRGRRIDCGCKGSVAPRLIGWGLVVADLGLAAMAVFAALADPGVLALGAARRSDASLTTQDGLALLLLSAVLVLAYQLVSSERVLRTATRAHRIATGAR